ncbi:MAG TPA: Kdo hydroxylase family protein, partial [Caulobacteraceae bacterium]|nr:Kdo hydroxylase family protein [Caulobacteraceae bacterium]
TKNISLDPATGRVGGAAEDADVGALARLLGRYAAWATALVGEVAPRYAPAIAPGRTSFRPRPVEDGAASPRKDDRRLHADAFPSRPVGGRRILRVFSNIDPAGEARVWRVGEPFEDYARRWLPRARRNLPGEAWALERLGITKNRRTDHDALMLGLHDRAKLDADYQATAPRREVRFPAGSSWMVFTDSVVHAAVLGRRALEQTFYLPVSAMADEAASPLRILERLTGRTLAP